jgi:hypothetical protein
MISLVFLVLVGFNAQGQKVEFSSKNLDDFSLGYTKVIGYSDSGFFMLSGSNGYEVDAGRIGFKSPKYKVGFVGNDLNLVWQKPLEVSVQNAEIRMVDCIEDRIVVIYSVWEKNQSTVAVEGFFIDDKGQHGESLKLGAFSGLNKEPFTYGVGASLHKDALALYLASETDMGSQLSVLTFSRELKTIANYNGTIKQPVRNFNIEQIIVSDSGDVMLLGLRSDKLKALSSKRENNWLAYAFLNGQLVEFPIGRGIEMPYLSLAVDEFRSEAVFSGLFTDQQSYVGAGIFYGRIGLKNDSIPEMQKITIDASQNLRLKGARNNGDGGGLAGFPIRKVIPRADGGLALIAESAFTTEYSYFDSFSQTYTRRLEYNFGDIVLFSIGLEGEMQWSASVNKEQISMDDGGIFSSYCMMIGSHSLDFLFSEPISKRAKVFRGSISYMGVPEKVTSLQLPEGTLLLSEGARQVSENSLVVPAIMKRKLHMLRLTY